jgi:Tol biopolymer transport system component
MIVRDDFDRMVSMWIDEAAGTGAPDYLDETLDGLARIGQRPAWMSPGRWLPMQLTMPRIFVPRTTPVLMLLALLVAIALIGLAIAGSRDRLPAPFGLAANGRIAYVSDGQLWTVGPDGANTHPITTDASVKGLPLFSRDGTRLAFIAYLTTSAYPSLVLTDADGFGPIIIVRDAEALRHVSWSPDGRTIAYSMWIAYEGQRDRIFVAPSDGSSPPTQIGDPDLSAFYPAFSPDSKQVAFVSDLFPAYCGASDCVGDQGGAMQVMTIEGKDLRKLAHGSIQPRIDIDQYARVIDWRPDGTSILFTGHEPSKPGSFGVYLVAAAGDASPRRIDTSTGSAYGAAWSPDADRIAYLRGEGDRWDLVVSGADGSHANLVATNVGRFGPEWSPDGRSIAVVDAVSGTTGAIRVVPVDGGPETIIPLRIVAPASSSAPGVDQVGWQRLAR